MQHYAPMQAAKLVHDYYMDHINVQEEYESIPEWTLGAVYEHMTLHMAPASVNQGGRTVQDTVRCVVF